MNETGPAAPAKMAGSRRPPHRLRSVRGSRALGAVAAIAVLTVGCGSGSGDPVPQRAIPSAERQTPTSPGDGNRGGALAAPESMVRTRPATVDAAAAPAARPVGLRVASIGVNVDIVPVGVEDDGDMAVPAARDAGWYRFGPRPGEPGSSVLAAHVDYDGRPGAFFRLRQLEDGDRVEVSMSDGSTASFVVTDLRRVDKQDLSASGVFERSGPARLALITCGGNFDRSRRSYEDNVVALAEPVA